MPIYAGNKKISKITLGGGANVKKVFKGSTLVFGKETFEQTFTANGSVTFPSTLVSLYVVVVGAGGGVGGNFYSNGSPGESVWNGYGKGGNGGFPSGSNVQMAVFI